MTLTFLYSSLHILSLPVTAAGCCSLSASVIANTKVKSKSGYKGHIFTVTVQKDIHHGWCKNIPLGRLSGLHWLNDSVCRNRNLLSLHARKTKIYLRVFDGRESHAMAACISELTSIVHVCNLYSWYSSRNIPEWNYVFLDNALLFFGFPNSRSCIPAGTAQTGSRQCL